jgi:hypothetical protein
MEEVGPAEIRVSQPRGQGRLSTSQWPGREAAMLAGIACHGKQEIRQPLGSCLRPIPVKDGFARCSAPISSFPHEEHYGRQDQRHAGQQGAGRHEQERGGTAGASGPRPRGQTHADSRPCQTTLWHRHGPRPHIHRQGRDPAREQSSEPNSGKAGHDETSSSASRGCEAGHPQSRVRQGSDTASRGSSGALCTTRRSTAVMSAPSKGGLPASTS